MPGILLSTGSHAIFTNPIKESSLTIVDVRKGRIKEAQGHK